MLVTEGYLGWLPAASLLSVGNARHRQLRRSRGLPSATRGSCHPQPRIDEGSDINSEHLTVFLDARLRSCYPYCMISPIRGDFTGFRVQVSDTLIPHNR